MPFMKAVENSKIEIMLFAFWATMVLWLVGQHSIWADEARAWLIATRTPTWGAMFEQTHTDGHPVLWYVFLRIGSSIHDSVTTLYVVHAIFAAIAVGFCLALKNVPLILRLFLVFGGILGYEYAVVARNYAPAAAAILAFAYFYPQREQRPWLLGFLLAFAANVHAGAVPLIPFLMLPWRLETWPKISRSFAIAATIIGIGILVMLATVYPLHPHSIFLALQDRYPLNIDNYLSSTLLFNVMISGLNDLGDFWNLMPFSMRLVIHAITLTMPLFLLQSWAMRLAACGMMVAATVFYCLFYPIPFYRHGAIVFVALFAFLAMDKSQSPRTETQKIGLAVFGVFLFLQFGRIVLAVSWPASGTNAITDAVNAQGLQHAQFICIPETMGQPLIAQGLDDCVMPFLDRKGPYPLFILDDYKRPVVTWSDIQDSMRVIENDGRPALAYIHHAFFPSPDREREETGRQRAWGKRFRVMGSDSEVDRFLAQTDIIVSTKNTLFYEEGVVVRLKPEFRGDRASSAPPRTDP